MKKILKLLAAVILLSNCIVCLSMAEEKESFVFTKNGEVVFLLDTSNSMNSYDKNRLVIDAVRQGAYSLPSVYKIGLVAYNTEIQASIGFGTSMKKIEKKLKSIEYTGYTNAGEGLEQAVKLFTDKEDVERSIIMITDGEIAMKDSAQMERSRLLFVEAANLAKEKGIRVYIAAIGSELKPGMHIFDAAEITGGDIYWEGASGTLTQIVTRILAERLQLPMQPIGVTYLSGGSIHAAIPKGAYRAVILINGGDVRKVKADYESQKGKIVAGQRFASINLLRPSSDYADVQFKTNDITGVQAFLLTEYRVKPTVATQYRIEKIPQSQEDEKKKLPPEYEHYVDISIGLQDTREEHDNYFQYEGFEGKNLTYTINGVSFQGTIKDGAIRHTMAADDIEKIEVTISLESLAELEAVFRIEQPVTAAVEKFPDPVFEPEPDYRPLWFILGGLGAVMLGIGIWWLKKSHTTIIYVAQPPYSNEPLKKLDTKDCTFCGKLNLYVVKTADGRDVPPKTYRLFGQNGGRMTLQNILTSCQIKLGKIGAEDIILYPGAGHSFIIMDQSERCTTLRGTEILKKGMGYPVFYNEKITIIFEDEATEMEIHYKNLKPSERNE